MKTIYAAICPLVAVIFVSAGVSLGQSTLPYHPFRAINGTNYNLTSLYKWQSGIESLNRSASAAWQEEHAAFLAEDTSRPDTIDRARVLNERSMQLSSMVRAAEKSQPHPNWTGAGLWSTFIVRQVLKENLLLVEWRFMPVAPENHKVQRIILKGYPMHDSVLDGEEIKFFALRNGSHHFESVDGSTRTLPLYDYGAVIEGKK